MIPICTSIVVDFLSNMIQNKQNPYKSKRHTLGRCSMGSVVCTVNANV